MIRQERSTLQWVAVQWLAAKWKKIKKKFPNELKSPTNIHIWGEGGWVQTQIRIYPYFFVFFNPSLIFWDINIFETQKLHLLQIWNTSQSIENWLYDYNHRTLNSDYLGFLDCSMFGAFVKWSRCSKIHYFKKISILALLKLFFTFVAQLSQWNIWSSHGMIIEIFFIAFTPWVYVQEQVFSIKFIRYFM